MGNIVGKYELTTPYRDAEMSKKSVRDLGWYHLAIEHSNLSGNFMDKGRQSTEWLKQADNLLTAANAALE